MANIVKNVAQKQVEKIVQNVKTGKIA